MTLSSGWGHDGVEYDGKEMRQLVEGLVGHNGIAQTPGVTRGLKATQQTSPATTVKVAAGNAIIAASGSGLFGEYHVANDASLNSPAFGATAANGRWDRLVLRVTSGVAALEIIAGTPAGSPTAPSITGDNVIPLYLVKIPSGTTNIDDSMLNDERVFVGKWAQPWGLVDYVQRVADQTGINTVVDLTGLTSTKTYVANRRIELTLFLPNVDSTTSAVFWVASLMEGATQLQAVSPATPAASQGTPINMPVIISPTAGAHTYKAQGMTGTAGGRHQASATAPAFLKIVDLGPSANPD